MEKEETWKKNLGQFLSAQGVDTQKTATVVAYITQTFAVENKYKILIDYGAYEGMRFLDDYETLDLTEAINVAQSNNFGSPFHIVKIVDWEVKEVK
jgi:hypothetical protein